MRSATLAVLAAAAAAHSHKMKYASAAEVAHGLMTLPKHGGTPARIQQLLRDNSTLVPQQLHLSLTNDPTEMVVMWVTMAGDATVGGEAQWWPVGNTSAVSTSAAVPTSYTAGLFGWNGTIHTTTMTGLVPGAFYQYTVGSGAAGTATWSEPRKFRAAPTPSSSASSYVAVVADQGTIAPMGWAVSDEIINEIENIAPFDLHIMAGDISYASIDPPNNEVEWTWDAYNIQIEPYASMAPYMAAPGNHEHVPGTLINATGRYASDFAAFSARYTMPGPQSGGNASIYFSFDYSNVHYTAICTEIDYSVGSPQWTFVQADLAKAAARRATVPWMIVMLHRPVLSADTDEYTSHCPGAPLATAFAPLFAQYGVDLVIQGHEHCYERTAAVDAFNGTIYALPSGPDNTYTNPGAPIYIVQGASGGMQEESFVTPPPAWSLVAIANQTFGFGRMNVTGATTLAYEFVDTNGAVQDAFRIVKTA